MMLGLPPFTAFTVFTVFTRPDFTVNFGGQRVYTGAYRGLQTDGVKRRKVSPYRCRPFPGSRYTRYIVVVAGT